MSTHFQAVFAAFTLLLAALAPLSAYAQHTQTAHSHAASYHSRTPVASTHGQHGNHHRG